MVKGLFFALAGFVAGGTFFIATSIVIAWAGPTAAPPNGNADAPINVGATSQVKNGGLAVNSLAVFGNAILSGTSRYLNFGSTAGASGYGFRDNAGTIQFRNNGGAWANLMASSGISSISFSDGTSQTTAARSVTLGSTVGASQSSSGSGGIMNITWTCPSGSFIVSMSLQGSSGTSGQSVNSVTCQRINF